MTGKVHSFTSMGAVDGPGVRLVVFMQGCPIRCAYCHNPDTWDCDGGSDCTSDEIVAKALRFKPYFGKDGGVTVSGGEALAQADFVAELFEKLHKNGINTALDTSGVCLHGAEKVLAHTDLVICDIKFTSEDDYRTYCKADYARVLDFLRLTEEMNVPLWIRQVIVPTLNDTPDSVKRLCECARKYSNLRKIELLPFRKLCMEKYERMGIVFPFADKAECSQKKIDELSELLK